MHSLPGRLHSLVYLRSSGPRRRGESMVARKSEKDGRMHPFLLRARRIREDLQRLSGRSSRAVHTLLARFTRHILRPLRSRLRSYVFTFTIVTGAPRGLLPRDNSSTFSFADTGISGLYPGLRTESSFFSSSLSLFRESLFAISKSSLSSRTTSEIYRSASTTSQIPTELGSLMTSHTMWST